jgi:hypothetical protein
MVSPTRVSATSLMDAVMKPNSPGPISSAGTIFGVKKPVRSTGYFAPGAHHADGLALPQHAVDDAHQHDDAEIGVVPAVDQHGLQRRGGVALARRRQAGGRSPRAPRSMPMPVLAEISTAFEASMPITSSTCSRMRSGSAAGRSILFSTTTISWSASIAW